MYVSKVALIPIQGIHMYPNQHLLPTWVPRVGRMGLGRVGNHGRVGVGKLRLGRYFKLGWGTYPPQPHPVCRRPAQKTDFRVSV